MNKMQTAHPTQYEFHQVIITLYCILFAESNVIQTITSAFKTN